MKTSQTNLIVTASLIILTLFAFKGKKESPLVLSADHRWRTEVSYDQAANVSGYILHNDKLTELVIFNIDSSGLENLLKTTARIGNPVNRIVLQKSNTTLAAMEINTLKRKFPQAKILVTAQ